MTKLRMLVISRRGINLVSRECTGSTNTLLSSIFKPVLCIIVPICGVGMIFHSHQQSCNYISSNLAVNLIQGSTQANQLRIVKEFEKFSYVSETHTIQLSNIWILKVTQNSSLSLKDQLTQLSHRGNKERT